MTTRQSLLILFGAVVLFPSLGASQTEAPGFVIWSAAELEGRNAALADRIRPDGSARETLADYDNPSGAHRFRFIRRDADGVPEQHAHIEDVVFVQSGSGTLVVGGELVPLNGERNAPWTNLDLRLTRRFRLGGAQVEALFEVFNLLNTGAFRVGHADQQEVFANDGVTPNPEFGLAGVIVGAPRQAQLGLRITF